MPTQRHPSYAGRWRHDLSPEWFDELDSTEAARLLTPPGEPLNFNKLNLLRARGLIRAVPKADLRWYRGDIERFADPDYTPEPEPDVWLERFLIGVLVGSVAITAAVISWITFR